jgi:hypothetical protein
MEDLLRFFDSFNGAIYKLNLESLSRSEICEERRNLHLMKLHLISKGFTEFSLADRILRFLTQLRLKRVSKYGNFFIKPNFIGLHMLKLFHLDSKMLQSMNAMSDTDLDEFLIKHLENDCYYNDNNGMICNESVTVNDECKKCGSKKIELHKSNECDIAICNICCYSWKLK